MVVLGNYTDQGAALRAEYEFKKLSRQQKIMYIREGGL
jgi:predicted GIY-YIG superfamily endonuclease